MVDTIHCPYFSEKTMQAYAANYKMASWRHYEKCHGTGYRKVSAWLSVSVGAANQYRANVDGKKRTQPIQAFQQTPGLQHHLDKHFAPFRPNGTNVPPARRTPPRSQLLEPRNLHPGAPSTIQAQSTELQYHLDPSPHATIGTWEPPGTSVQPSNRHVQRHSQDWERVGEG